MEPTADTVSRTLCSTCLSTDRNVVSLNSLRNIYQLFRRIIDDYSGYRYGDSIKESDQMVCWECLAIMKKIIKFKQQVHHAQEHLRLARIQSLETKDQTTSQSLSSLKSVIKNDYDKVIVDLANDNEKSFQHYITISTSQNDKESYNVGQKDSDQISENIDNHGILDSVPEIMLENPVTGMMSHIVVEATPLNPTDYAPEPVKGDMAELSIDPSVGDTALSTEKQKKLLTSLQRKKSDMKSGYTIERMTETKMLAVREEAKKMADYVSLAYKCELCIIGFYTQQQVEDHLIAMHRERPGYQPCRICYVYEPEAKLDEHINGHYMRYACRLCGKSETSVKMIQQHVRMHLNTSSQNTGGREKDRKIKKGRTKENDKTQLKPGDMRKLHSKTTIVGYKCLECNMFFKTSKDRHNHARIHKDKLQCDHCKKAFVNRTVLIAHLRLHEGPLPREECPICHKTVRSLQIKYHIQRHQNTSRYECKDCSKIFSHLTTYQGHLKYSRRHASEQVLKFPCPMCNKGYPTKETMQDHFNYQHLGKTTHKCPVCSKPIASQANVERHMRRIHGEKKPKPRNHVCAQCGKSFTDRKDLIQHEAIHSGHRLLTCDICQDTFKQKASLYTHRKRVHKVFPNKRVVEFMESKNDI